MSHTVTRYGVEVDLSYVGHIGCPRCLSRGKDNNKDNMMSYGLDNDDEHQGATCFACDYKIPSLKWLRENGQEQLEEDVLGSHFDADVHVKLKEITGTNPKGYRGIREDISRPFGVRYSYSTETGDVVESYYPTTINYEIAGYKKRIHPKDFTQPVGITGKDCELFGQFKFKNHSSTIVVCAGEVDTLSAYQMLSDSMKEKKYDPPAVVSGTTGESSTFKQIQAQYQFFNKFKKIVICMDNDKAGKEAFEKILKVLPRNKIYLMRLELKDANDYLKEKKEKEFVQAFWNAKLHTPAGVYASTDLYEAALDCLDARVITLPPFMKIASDMLGGGLVVEEITVILAKTSIGKTLLVNEITKHIIEAHPEHTLGVLSLEATYKKYSRNLLSSFLSIPLHRKTKEEKAVILENNKERIQNFYVKGDGTPKFFVCDDRGATVDSIKEKVLEMIISFGVTILVIDPYSDLLSGMTVSEQEELATWLKRIMKEYGITPVVISHVKKGDNNSDERLTEDSAMGSSFLVKGAGITIALERNKQAEDPTERNRTYCYILKNREFSETGAAGSFYYDIKTATLYDYDQWMSNIKTIDVKF